jgi:hypothetical protein
MLPRIRFPLIAEGVHERPHLIFLAMLREKLFRAGAGEREQRFVDEVNRSGSAFDIQQNYARAGRVGRRGQD